MKQSKPLIANRWRISIDDLQSQFEPHKACLHQALPTEAGNGHSKIFQFDKGLSYIETLYNPSKDLSILSQMDSEPRMVVTLGLKGHSRFSSKQGNEVVFNEGYTTITTFNSSVGERQYQADQTVSQLRLSITKKWLESYWGEKQSQQFFNTGHLQQISRQPISYQAIVVAQHLSTGKVADSLQQLFMQGLAMSLLASELSQLVDNKQSATEKFTHKERGMAMLAREVLLSEFKQPPSLDALSKRVGTNQFKLKKLFHHFFNNTPYGLLLEIRMNHAYQLLQSTRCQVAIAADFVGYSHASNFSTAFIKHFGVSPKTVAKTLSN